MASLEDLTEAIKETLTNRGVMDQLRARVRAEIFNSLEDKDQPKPQLSSQNLILNELIREYLEFNQYKQSLSVFLPETGQPKDRLQRKFLAKETNIVDDPTSASVPLLYIILEKLQQEDAFPNKQQQYQQQQQQQHQQQHQQQQQYPPNDYSQDYDLPTSHYSSRNQPNTTFTSSQNHSNTQSKGTNRGNKSTAKSSSYGIPSSHSQSQSYTQQSQSYTQSMSQPLHSHPTPLYDDYDVQPLVFTHK